MMSRSRYVMLLPVGPAIAAGVTLFVHFYGGGEFYEKTAELWIAAAIWVGLCLRYALTRSKRADRL